MYITPQEYADFSLNCPLPKSTEILQLIEAAQAKIDEVTFNRINAVGFENLTPFQQNNVKKAMLHQTDYFYQNGFDGGDVQSYSVLDISIAMKDADSLASKMHISPVALQLLKATGLCDRRC